MKKILIVLFLITAIQTALPKQALAQSIPTTLTTLTTNSNSVGRFQKFEATFQISRSFPVDSMLPYYFFDASDSAEADPGRQSPYAIEGITIDGHFRSPSCTQQACEKVVPAFYYQDYIRGGGIGQNETMTPTHNFSWKIRFSPEEVGTYTYYITLTDRSGSSRYPTNGTLSFTSTTSAAKGFIRVSPRDPRFLEYQNGESYIPIGSAHQWWRCCGKRSWDYEETFDKFGANGINLVRIWDQNDGYSLTVEGHYDAYNYPQDYKPTDAQVAGIPKGTQMNQRGNYEEDKIIEAAERNAVAILLSSHGDPYWIWDASVYNEGWNPHPVLMSDTQHLAYWKRNFRYRVARFGYSTSILAWEAWNEMDRDVSVGSDLYNFYQTYGEYQKATDPYGHARTTSKGSQNWQPALWASGAFDLANFHDYMMPGRYSPGFYDDEVNFVYTYAQCLRAASPVDFSKCPGVATGGGRWLDNKPIIWGELDTGTSNWDVANPQPVADHNIIWAGLLSPLGHVPIDWYYNKKDSYITQKYSWLKIASDFFKGVDYAGKKFSYLSTDDVRVNSSTVVATHEKLRVLAIRAQNNAEAYAWIQHKDYTWGKASQSRTALSGSFTIPGMVAGSYIINYTNTETGSVTSSGTVSANGGNVTIPIINLSKDLAVKIISTTFPTPSPTSVISPSRIPTPTPTLNNPQPTTNLDCRTHPARLTCFEAWRIAFTSGTYSQDADMNGNGKVTISDFEVWRRAYTAGIPTPSPTTQPSTTLRPSNPPASPTGGQPTTAPSEWTQFAHDASRTSYTSQTVSTPWKYKWQWNGAGSDGKKLANHLSVPKLVQPITGGGRVYMIASDTVFALASTNGTLFWSRAGLGTLSSTPIYDNEFLYLASEDGKLYKLDAARGTTVHSYTAGSPLKVAPLWADGVVYIGTEGGLLIAVSSTTMNEQWRYSTASPVATTPSFSKSKNLVIVGSRDLYLHAVNALGGSVAWKKKPTILNTGDPGQSAGNNFAQFEEGWPVVADGHGIVFVRYRLDWNTLWGANPFPTTNAAIRTFLQNNPSEQALFALNLTDGSQAFIPAVGNGGAGDGNFLPMGTQPVVKTVDGHEVVYIIWRNGQTCGGCAIAGPCGNQWCDGREDATMGEMVLDSLTINGYQAGDLRFVNYEDIQTDEMMNLSVSGDTVFHSHWLVSEARRITDRSFGKGNSFTDPIQTVNAPFVIWRQCSGTNICLYPGCTSNTTCGSSCVFNAQTRYCPNELYSYGDQRQYPPGFYEYINDHNTGSTPFTVVSAGLVLVKTIDGGLLALENGNPTAYLSDTKLAQKDSSVLGAHQQPNQPIQGIITSMTNHRPKALYFKLTTSEGIILQLRIFEKDIRKFPYELSSLQGKTVQVVGSVSLYWPEGNTQEVIISSPEQLKIR